MLYCYLDTNIFHEFKPITEINWVKELGTSEVCLVVTSIVVQELDKHKSGGNNRLKKRAKKWTAFLETLDITIDNEIRQNVTLRLDLAEPKDGTFDKHNLSTSVADDRLLAKALEFEMPNEGDIVAVVSYDSAVRLKARGYNLVVPTLSEDYRLEYEPDPVMQELKELRIENQRLQNTQPTLKIGFLSDDATISHIKHVSLRFMEDLISNEEIEAKLKQKFKELKYRPQTFTDKTSPLYGTPLPDPFVTAADIEEYNAALRSWLNLDYRNYLIEDSLYWTFENQSIDIALALENSGSVPAENIEIVLQISDCRKVFNEPPLCPSQPISSKPDSPQSVAHSRILESSFSKAFRAARQSFESGVQPSVKHRFTIDNVGMKQVSLSLQKLMHHRTINLEEYFLIVDRPNRFPHCVTIEYEVIAENMIDRVTGELKIIINEEVE